VLVMGVADLPSSIAAGACALQPGCGFPLGLTEASAKGRAEEAYPVLVLGTQVTHFSPFRPSTYPAHALLCRRTAL